MNKESLSDGIGEIRDDLVHDAATPKKKQSYYKKMFAAVAVIAVAAATVIAAVRWLPALKPGRTVPAQTEPAPVTETVSAAEQTTAAREQLPGAPLSFAQISATYPVASLGTTDRESALGYAAADFESLPDNWYREVLPEFLRTDPGENAAFSPLNLLVSLSCAAEMSSGDTQRQILNLLGVRNTPDLRRAVRAIWLDSYRNTEPEPGRADGYPPLAKLIPANSFWLNKTVELAGAGIPVAEILRDDYFTSFYKGDPADPSFGETYRAWINAQTEGLLEDAVRRMDFTPDLLFSMVSTLLLKAGWIEPFDEAATREGTFYGETGEETASFMVSDDNLMASYLETADFTAAAKSCSVGDVWFILPGDGITVRDLVENAAYEAILAEYRKDYDARFDPGPDYDGYALTLTVPRFDVQSSFDLRDGLRALGVKDLFDRENARIPFVTPKNGENVYISEAKQDVRVSIDEKGVYAAAVTRMGAGFGAPVFREVSLTADRPFLFLIVTGSGIPCFAGVINSAGG